MWLLLRAIGVLLLSALIIVPSVVAQDGETITVIGSGIVEPLFSGLADASAVEANLAVEVTGTRTGFEQFCAGEADITAANRPIASAESEACISNEVNYIDLTLGQQVAAFITSADTDFLTCLTGAQLDRIFAPSATIASWEQLIDDAPETPLSLFIPSESSPIYALVDEQVDGLGIRRDATTQADSAVIIEEVAATAGALGIVSLNEAVAAGDSIRILDIDAGAVPGCQSPTAATAEEGLYPIAAALRIYVNTASLEKPGMDDLLTALIADDAAATVNELGFTAPTSAAYERARAILSAAQAGEILTTAGDDFVPPVGLAGDVQIGGEAIGFAYLNAIQTRFTETNPAITITSALAGVPVGARRFCNGELDLLVASSALTEAQTENCEANEIETLTLGLGSDAVVLVANAASDYLACLTTDALISAWGATTEEAITTWDQVDASFPAESMFLFAPALGDFRADLLLAHAEGAPAPLRADAQFNADPLYRAAATANVVGGMAYMNWAEYQRVLNNNQANIQLVAVDAGAGCVTPSVESITDGSYPLARPLSLIINRSALAEPGVQSLLWFMFSDENYASLEASGLYGLRFGQLGDIRETLRRGFLDAEAALAEAVIEPEVEATDEPEAEAEATDEPEAEATEAASGS